MTKPEREHRAREIIQESGADTAACLQRSVVANLGTTFRQQADWWIQHVQQRKRRPVKERTAKTWKSHLIWINPRIGDTPLSEVNNRMLRDLVEQMSEAGFKPKSILNYCFVVKAVVASAISKDGEELFPRKWNHEFMDLPEIGEQNTPIFTSAEIEQIIALANSRDAVLYSVLAAGGMRIGEALALKVPDFRDQTLSIQHSLWTSKLTSPKTRFSVREVDLSTPVAEMLSAFIGERTAGYIFQTSKGTALGQRNLLRDSLHPILKIMKHDPCGFHAFRRYRITHLRKQRTQEDLLDYWVGHSPETVTDGYVKIKGDLDYRKAEVERVGIGFNLGSCPFKSLEGMLVN